MAEPAPTEDVRSLVETHRATLIRLVDEADGSEASRLIARRAAALATWCDSAELLMSQGRAIDMQAYLKAVSTLHNLLADAGISRAARPMRDITNWSLANVSERDQARAVLFMHAKAKREGTAHLLPDSVLDLVASVQPVPEPTHETIPTRQ
jgi:hypothetical protein